MGDDSADNEEETQRGEKELFSLCFTFSLTDMLSSIQGSTIRTACWPGKCMSFGPVDRTVI